MIVGTRSDGREKGRCLCHQTKYPNNDPSSFHRVRWKLYGTYVSLLALCQLRLRMRRMKEILQCSCKRSLVGSWAIATGEEC
jgi:hypothetical protein